MRTVTVTILFCLAVAMVGNSVEVEHGDTDVEELSPHVKELSPNEVGAAPKKFTAAEQKEFHEVIGEIAKRVGAEGARDIGERFGDEIHAWLNDKKLGEDEGLKSHAKFIGGLAAAAGGGMITKLLDPYIKKLPEMFRPLVRKLIPKMLKGDKEDMKKTLITGVIDIAKENFINKAIAKLPEEFRPMFNEAVDKLLEGITKFPPSVDAKALKEILKKGIMDYGVKKVEAVVETTTAQLPDFAKEPAKSAAMDLVKQQSAALLAKIEEDELGEKQKEDTGFNPGKLLIEEGVKAVKGMAPPMIEKMVEHLPGPLEPAKEPLKESLTSTLEKIMDVLAQPSKWNEEGKKEITNILIATAMDLGNKLKSALPIEYDQQLGEDVAKIRKQTGRSTLAQHLGKVSKHLAAPVSAALGESMSEIFTHSLTKNTQHEVKKKKKRGKARPQPRIGKPRGKAKWSVNGIKLGQGEHQGIRKGKKKKKKKKKSKKKSKKKGKSGGSSSSKKSSSSSSSMFGKLAGMAKKAGGAALASGGAAMLKPMIKPKLQKIPLAFRPMMEAAIMKLIDGDKEGAKKVLLDSVPTVAVKLLETMPEGSPLMTKIPEEFRPLVKDTLLQLLKGDVKGAVAVLKQKIIQYGVKKIETLVTPMTKMIPFPPAQEPAKMFLLDNIKKIASAHVAEERRRALGETIAEDTRTNEQVGLDIAKLVMGEGIKMIGGVVPPAIDDMVAKLPSALEPAKEPLTEVLKKMFTDIVGVLGQGPSKWNNEGMKEVTELVIAAAKGLADKLKAAGLQAMGVSEKQRMRYQKYRFTRAAIERTQQLEEDSSRDSSLDLNVEDALDQDALLSEEEEEELE